MFSGAVKIGDLNDFIAPSQACVVSLGTGKPGKQPHDAEEVGTVQLQQPRGVARPALVPAQPPLPPTDPVKISLHDCLACSGCVTSAETVLLQQQSIDELETRLADPGTSVLFTLSPQSVTSLAVYYGMPPRDTATRLAPALRSLGAAAVFDLSAARDVALLESAAEFVHRYRQSQRGATELASSGCAGGGGVGVAALPLPMLASACPGWVCYAEKTHGSFVLPHISVAKSPQAVAGTLLKRAWCSLAGLPPDRAFHCAVMPCYDKKLEASRDDFVLPGGAVPETDCVLATTELLELLQKRGLDLESVQPQPGPAFDSILQPGQGMRPGAELSGVPGGAGGYLEFIFRTAAQELFGQEVPLGPLHMEVGRNADFRECWLEVGGRRVLRFARAYGFRNIQGLMRKIRLGKCEYDYVEIMACPSGCLNGGGQIRPGKGETPQQLIERLEVAYHWEGGGLAVRWPQDSLEAREVYERVVRGGVGSPAAAQLFHTQYHQREKSVTATLGDW